MQSSRAASVCRLAVADAAFLTLREKLRLLSILRSVADSRGTDAALAELASMGAEEISAAVGRRLRRADWDGPARLASAERSHAIISSLGISAVFWGDEGYPPLLRLIPDPPFSLFYRGRLAALSEPCVSVVGSRRADAEALRETEQFAFDAASDGRTVVSGLAFGVDVAAHRGALRSAAAGSGSTVAVLPGGIDEITPKSHTRVAARMLAAGGAVLSEYTPGTPAAAWRFVQRNRIIAALSPATVVMQSPPGGGALHTAAFALDYDRELVFHSSNFTPAAAALAAESRSRMSRSRAATCAAPEGFVSEGARVVSSWAEFARPPAAIEVGGDIVENEMQGRKLICAGTSRGPIADSARSINV